jgi:hypothetical protein
MIFACGGRSWKLRPDLDSLALLSFQDKDRIKFYPDQPRSQQER